MSKLDEKILKAIKTAYELALASASTEEQKKGIDNFYHIHLNPLQFQIPTWTEQAIEVYIAERILEKLEYLATSDPKYTYAALKDEIAELKSNERVINE